MSEKNNSTIKVDQTNIKAPSNSNKKTLIISIIVALVIIGGASGYLYWKISSSRVYTDKAAVFAQTVDLAPENSGTLEEVLVNVGDHVDANTVVARVGDELIKSKISGIITSTQADTGKLFNHGEAVVTMLDPSELRVVGQIDEDKGLSDIRVGQTAVFTIDAFGSKKYEGVVDEISPVSRQGDIVFNISDKREVKQFDVKIRFDINKYPELKNGMSAKLWIYR